MCHDRIMVCLAFNMFSYKMFRNLVLADIEFMDLSHSISNNKFFKTIMFTFFLRQSCNEFITHYLNAKH